MRTFREFQKEVEESHNCESCRGKIFSITIDMFGNKRCSYCHEIVNYPEPTKEELKDWMKELQEKIKI